jgi:hypothetical protein
MLNEFKIVIPVVVVILFIVTPVTSSKFLPTRVKIVPLTPVNGDKDVIVGGGHDGITFVVVFKLFGSGVTPA